MIPGLRLLAEVCEASAVHRPTRADPRFRDAVDRLLKASGGPGL